MSKIKLNLQYSGIDNEEILEYREKVEEIHKELHEISTIKTEFAGWLNLPTKYDKKEFERIKKAAKRIAETSEVLLVIGIGGSYLGARAVIESLTSSFYNLLPFNKRATPQVFFVGNNISPNYLNELINVIRKQRHIYQCNIKIRNYHRISNCI